MQIERARFAVSVVTFARGGGAAPLGTKVRGIPEGAGGGTPQSRSKPF